MDAASSRSAKKSNRLMLTNPSIGDEELTHADDDEDDEA